MSTRRAAKLARRAKRKEKSQALRARVRAERLAAIETFPDSMTVREALIKAKELFGDAVDPGGFERLGLLDAPAKPLMRQLGPLA